MALSDTSKTLISIKKLVGKAHTSNDKDVANESLSSGLTVSTNTIFAQSIPSHTGSSPNYHILSNSSGFGVVEFLRLSASFIAGTDTSSGRHGFSLQLPDDYQSKSKNPKKGSDPFTNGREIYLTTGSLQLVPPSFDSDYEAKVYHTGSGETQVPVLDSRDWNLDYFNGIFFQQDPPGTGDQSTNPRYVDAYLYIGEYTSKGYFESGISGSLTKLPDGKSFIEQSGGVTVSSASGGAITIAVPSYVFSEYLGMSNGSNTKFTFNYQPDNVKNVSVFVNGIFQAPATSITSAGYQDYSVTGSNMYFTTGSLPESGSVIFANYSTSATTS
jgi:hypothetical protein